MLSVPRPALGSLVTVVGAGAVRNMLASEEADATRSAAAAANASTAAALRCGVSFPTSKVAVAAAVARIPAA